MSMETRLRSVTKGVLGTPAILDFDDTMSVLVGHHVNCVTPGNSSFGIDYVKLVADKNKEKK